MANGALYNCLVNSNERFGLDDGLFVATVTRVGVGEVTLLLKPNQVPVIERNGTTNTFTVEGVQYSILESDLADFITVYTDSLRFYLDEI